MACPLETEVYAIQNAHSDLSLYLSESTPAFPFVSQPLLC